jgi:hypothetical protein
LRKKRLAFMARLNEKWGIEKIQAHTVTVGPKFVSLTPDEKQSFLHFLATDVYDPPADEPWELEQTIVVVEISFGRRTGPICRYWSRAEATTRFGRSLTRTRASALAR